MRKACLFAAVLALVALLAAGALGAAAQPVVSISNEYIKIIVNAGEAENGRFGVETTGGDPENPNDDSMPLIYGRPVPWTSYTTVRIDGEDWVFGGRASKRAGLKGKYGTVALAPSQRGSSISTAYVLGPVRAVQDLSFARSQMTGYYDTARIAYTLLNTSDKEVVVGLRLMIDTMLGANDGAPLRAGELGVVSDAGFSGNAMPDFWQAFDSLTEPSVTSQATLRGGELTVPGRVAFSNWGAFADSLWDVRLVAGRDFTREGEFDLDSAAAMYWDGLTLAPNAQVTLVTYYGLGGIVLSPGVMSIGLAAPAEVAAVKEGQPSSFMVVAYVQNTGKGPALDVKATLELPKGLKLQSGSAAVRNVGDIKQGAMTQLSWQIASDGTTYGDQQLKLRVESFNADNNSITRSVRLLSPPRLSLRLEPATIALSEGGGLEPSYPVKAVVTNVGDSSAYWAEASLELTGAKLAPGDTTTKQLGHFEPGEAYKAVWYIMPGALSQAVQLRAKASAANAKQVGAISTLDVPKVQRGIRLELEADGAGFAEARVMAVRLSDIAKIEFDIAWDGDALVPLGRKPVNPGYLMLLPDGTHPGFGPGTLQSGAVRGITCSFLPGGEPDGQLVSIDFRIAKAGGMTISLENVKAYDAAGKAVAIVNDGLEAIIRY